MKQKFIYALLFLLVSFSRAFAQTPDVKLQKGQILINGIHAYDYSFFNHKKELYLYKIGSNEDVVILQRIGKKIAEEHVQFFFIYFEGLKKSLETKEYITYPWPFILQKLINEKVISSAGNVNQQETLKFIQQYDEHLTKNLITAE